MRRPLEVVAAAVFVPRSTSSRLPLHVWSAAAVISIAVSSAIALQPGYLADLVMVRDWIEYISSGRGNPYLAFRDLDYPPHALILLMPLGWLDDTALRAVFIPLIVAATAGATWMMSGWLASQFGIELTRRDRAVLVALAVASSSMRGTIWRGQLAPLAFLLGAAAIRFKQSRPMVSAWALALCAFKPHVALGFALAILVTAGARVLIVAGGMVVALSWCFAAVSGVGVIEGWQSYVTNLWLLYDGPERVRGLLSIRWVIEEVAGSYHLGTMVYLTAAAVTGSLLLDAALATTEHSCRTRVAAALLLWTLIFLPHQLYHGWMAAPAMWLMMWPESDLIRHDRIRLAAVSAFITFGVLDVPRMMRLVIDVDSNWALGLLSYALNPLRVALLFALLLWAITMRRPAGNPMSAEVPHQR